MAACPQEGFSGAARTELTKGEPLGSAQYAEAQNYLVELGFQLSHKAASRRPVCKPVPCPQCCLKVTRHQG